MKVELPPDWSDELKSAAAGMATVTLTALFVSCAALLVALIALGKAGSHAN